MWADRNDEGWSEFKRTQNTHTLAWSALLCPSLIHSVIPSHYLYLTGTVLTYESFLPRKATVERTMNNKICENKQIQTRHALDKLKRHTESTIIYKNNLLISGQRNISSSTWSLTSSVCHLICSGSVSHPFCWPQSWGGTGPGRPATAGLSVVHMGPNSPWWSHWTGRGPGE